MVSIALLSSAKKLQIALSGKQRFRAKNYTSNSELSKEVYISICGEKKW